MLSVIKTAQANLTIFTEGFASDLCPPPPYTYTRVTPPTSQLLPGSAQNSYLIPEKVHPGIFCFYFLMHLF